MLNDNFADLLDVAGWTATGSLVGEPTGGSGQLATDGSFQRTLEQTFSLPAAPGALAFDFAFSTETGAQGPAFPDSFAALLVTAGGDFLDILVVDLLAAIADPSDCIEGITGALPIDVDLDALATIPGFLPFAGGTTYSGRISLMLPAAVLGQEATIYFDLFDEPEAPPASPRSTTCRQPRPIRCPRPRPSACYSTTRRPWGSTVRA
jgi:hypothetical protein